MELKAGRELDAMVAEKVMGIPVTTRWRTTGKGTWSEPYSLVDAPVTDQGLATGLGQDIPHYSTDLVTAMEVCRHAFGDTAIHINWSRNAVGVDFPGGYVSGDTLEHAVCLAALEFVGIS